eukprot:scaffold62660_cov30-Tisochrysis_lutea.AAC.4
MVLPPVETTKFTKDYPRLKICVTGAGGFIASHLAKRLKEEGHYVRAVDWKENEYMEQSTFCDEFLNLDLRFPDACKQACEGMEWCFNLAVSAGLWAGGVAGLQEGGLARADRASLAVSSRWS